MTDMACCPNWSELSVSKASEEEGATHTQSAVLARPPKAPESSRVSLLSRKGGLGAPFCPAAARAWLGLGLGLGLGLDLGLALGLGLGLTLVRVNPG